MVGWRSVVRGIRDRLWWVEGVRVVPGAAGSSWESGRTVRGWHRRSRIHQGDQFASLALSRCDPGDDQVGRGCGPWRGGVPLRKVLSAVGVSTDEVEVISEGELGSRSAVGGGRCPQLRCPDRRATKIRQGDHQSGSEDDATFHGCIVSSGTGSASPSPTPAPCSGRSV